MEFCIRLDDACPQMNLEKWNRVEHLLDQYEIKPLVGVIPDNQDPDFQAEPDHSFWEKAVQWKNKGWSIALHGLHHKLESHAPQGYYQLSHSRKTEWAGKSTSEQYQMLLKGYHILEQHGLTPTCFFAPCHTYDASTIEALKLMAAQGKEMYISDGYSLKPYKKSNICFYHLCSIRRTNYPSMALIHLYIIQIICPRMTLTIWKTFCNSISNTLEVQTSL